MSQVITVRIKDHRNVSRDVDDEEGKRSFELYSDDDDDDDDDVAARTKRSLDSETSTNTILSQVGVNVSAK